jgi:hypothetical protein
MAGKPFTLIGINGDEPGEELKKKNKDAEITWRSFQNARGEGKKDIADEWNVQGWPTLYLIDHKGTIRHKWLGSPGDEVIDKEIDALVKEADAQDTK